ncbi:MAG: hypothetical protein AAF460_17450 [Pseudomonadota bacterium]
MQRFLAVACVVNAPVALASDPRLPFWHLGAHGDSIALICLGLWLVRRQCMKTLYPESPPRSRRGAGMRGLSGSRTALPLPLLWAQVASLRSWLRSQIHTRKR